MMEHLDRKEAIRRMAAISVAPFIAPKLILPGISEANNKYQVPNVIVKKSPSFDPSSNLGINVNPALVDCNAKFIKDLGASWVRLVLNPHTDFGPYLRELESVGLEAVCVIGQESIKVGDWNDENLLSSNQFKLSAEYYAEKYSGYRFALQIGNEPDNIPTEDRVESEASWWLYQEVFNNLLESYREVFTDRFLIAGGVCTGDSYYLDRVNLSHVNAFAVQLYGVDTPEVSSNEGFTDAASALGRYKINLPVFITETGVNHLNYTDDEAVKYSFALLNYYIKRGIPIAYYCLSDLMHDDHGIFDKNGNPKPILKSFLKVAWGEDVPIDSFHLNPVKEEVVEKEPVVQFTDFSSR
ncbi:hypothetical protein A2858_02445 [Candidatus Daviesbacteria bacterium RIFCSPHIGHO2_01_FULL_36_37]|uniref:Glycoside hydrolase family 5 domain-containing protein n=4 Tax=Candidatus Daviesiibacteriota TaxID=1752718 RepID=A0A1F5K216_9BACT|nr:MAG: hypothetical protein A2858_02445 [Candidatus Daviesbacteria bacterium RIFCSPHIGHO2_01_FULL_36_37]OGE31645.1 MAG: hypothetical protein A3C99_01830 [Candidatus Daviesbacteria bacterium RIFCSPHIGHO2_02_FULL_37_9]OGE34751.1 MAG: hypothetical protein A3E66_03965 [Candidatus Daviesbacteria bacterium RIFCSPHIGHO2_12_FULL_37_16]